MSCQCHRLIRLDATSCKVRNKRMSQSMEIGEILGKTGWCVKVGELGKVGNLGDGEMRGSPSVKWPERGQRRGFMSI